VNTVTSPAGITLTYLPAVETPTSTQSAGFSATFKHSVPNHGDVTVKLTFGRVAVQVESLIASAPGSVDGPETPVDVGAPLPSGPGNSELGSAGGWNGGPSANGSSATPTTPPLGLVRPGSPSLANSDSVQEPASGTRSWSGTASAAGGRDQAALAWREKAASLAAGYHTDGGHGLYLALIIGGLAILVGGLIFGPRAVRTPATHVLRVPPR
jgi:hypothetical protein